jgi:hypothetical protein
VRECKLSRCDASSGSDSIPEKKYSDLERLGADYPQVGGALSLLLRGGCWKMRLRAAADSTKEVRQDARDVQSGACEDLLAWIRDEEWAAASLKEPG